MRFAIVDGNKVEAAKGIKGVCPNCGSSLIAKCGDKKRHHWAHKNVKTCDQWWEKETDWHRSWKNNYPKEWQEVNLEDKLTREKHIADILTGDGLVIEFQHSHIEPRERVLREKFYKRMVWVVDGTRLIRDSSRLFKGRKDWNETEKKGIFLVDFPEESFPAAWIESSVPVVLDFKGLETTDNNNDVHKMYCLLPLQKGGSTFCAEIPRKGFIRSTINGEWSTRLNQFIRGLGQQNQRSPLQLSMGVSRRVGTHVYDPKKGKMVPKWRF